MGINFQALSEAASLILTLETIAFLGFGVVIGITFGAIPGLNATLAVALAMIVVYPLPLHQALAVLVGCYKGGIYGGSITAISFKTPGSEPSAATVADGYALTEQGHGGKALKMALYSSVAADTASDFIFIFAAIPLGMLAPRMGPPQLTALFGLSLTLLIVFTADDPGRGIIGAGLGLFIASIGRDPMSGVLRFTFGVPGLRSGVSLVPLLLGLFAIPEIIHQIGMVWNKKVAIYQGISKEQLKERLSFKEFLSAWRGLLVGTLTGTVLGALPGPGATLASFTSYGIAKQVSRQPELYGKGSLEAVAAAEAGNNATSGPTFIPLITFGIPGSVIAGLFGGALMMQGVPPGPRMFVEHPTVIYMFFLVQILGNPFNLVLGSLLIRVYTKLASVPRYILWPLIGVFVVVGVYMTELRGFDILVLFGAGLLGYLLRTMRIPLGPFILTFLIAPLLEGSFRRSLILSHGNPLYFVKDPIAAVLWGLTVLVLILQINRVRAAKSKSTSERGDV